jgi:hypothetical protein
MSEVNREPIETYGIMVALALDLCLEAVVAGLTNAGQILGIMEQINITTMWDDVVHHSGFSGLATGQTELTQWLLV